MELSRVPVEYTTILLSVLRKEMYEWFSSPIDKSAIYCELKTADSPKFDFFVRMADVEVTLEEGKRPLNKKRKLDDNWDTKEQGLKNKLETEEENQRALLYDSDGYSDDEERQRDTQRYMAQIKASGGYQVDYFPKLVGLMGMTVLVSDFPKEDEQLEELSNLAVEAYNKVHGSNYILKKVVNGTARGAGVTIYYLTFLAKEGDSAAKCFQARVHERFCPSEINVISCDLKATDSAKDD